MQRSCPTLRAWFPLAAIAAVLPFSAGCEGLGPQVWVSDTQVLEFSAADLETFAATTRNGKVKIVAHPDAGSIVVEVEIKASGRDEMEAFSTLDLVEIISRRTGDDESALELFWEWRSKPEWNRGARVSYRARVPEDLALRLKSHNGDIEADGRTGSVATETHNGDITVHAPDRAAPDSRLTAETHNGRVDIRSPAEDVQIKSYNGRVNAQLLSNGRLGGKITAHNGKIHLGVRPSADVELRARTHNGRVSCDLPRDLVADREKSPKSFEGVLGKGGERLSMVSHNGRIEIEEVDDDFDEDDDDDDDDDDEFDIEIDFD